MRARVLASILLALAPAAAAQSGDGFLSILREPDRVVLVTETGDLDLARLRPGDFGKGDAHVRVRREGEGLQVELAAPTEAACRVQLWWKGAVDPSSRLLGDAWERGYGDLQWAAPDPARSLPWYFLASARGRTHGYGVRTGPSALCAWRTDPGGLSLLADVRCGGSGVRLGRRVLPVCTVMSREGGPGESPFQAARAFCRALCPAPRLPREPVYGFNDWYWAYGDNSAESVLADAAFTASLAPVGGPRPYMVIDDGWQGDGALGPRPWAHGNAKFPDMPGLARAIREAGCRPGIWYRPLKAAKDDPAAWRLQRSDKVLDPTVPAVLDQVAAEVARLRAWGFELVKHDFSTVEVTGAWGFQMGGGVTKDGWAFADRSVTTAEAVLRLYRRIREAAGDAVVIGCNTFGHLGAGIFEVQRTGDDTSGEEWDRTRKMGVNTLAFRSCQHGAFFLADPDCVGLAKAGAIPWEKNRQWLRLAARSGMPLFISLRRDALDAGQVRELREALAEAARPHPPAEPLDWMETPLPRRWKLDGAEAAFDW